MLMTKYAGSAFVKVANLANGPQGKTVESVDEGQYGRPVITFTDGKRLSVNVTNVNTLIELFGEDSTDWVGKRVELYVGPLRNQDGGESDGVKVRLPTPSAKSLKDDLDDTIPF
jgi:hypothetical protein